MYGSMFVLDGQYTQRPTSNSLISTPFPSSNLLTDAVLPGAEAESSWVLDHQPESDWIVYSLENSGICISLPPWMSVTQDGEAIIAEGMRMDAGGVGYPLLLTFSSEDFIDSNFEQHAKDEFELAKAEPDQEVLSGLALLETEFPSCIYSYKKQNKIIDRLLVFHDETDLLVSMEATHQEDALEENREVVKAIISSIELH